MSGIGNMRLTSPLTKSYEVQLMQAALKKKGYYNGAIDSIYGPLTDQAAYRAKYYLGYPVAKHGAGNRLFNYLVDVTKPSLAMRALAAKRKPRPAVVPWRVVFAKKAAMEIGVKESPPGSNHVKYAEWYGADRQPWCAMFVTWCGESMFKTFRKGHTYAYVPYIVADARAGLNNLTLAQHPLTGVVACYDWDKDGKGDHVGICVEERWLEKWVPHILEAAKRDFGPLGVNDFWAIEGNTSVGNDSNGGAVELRKRSLSQVIVLANAS